MINKISPKALFEKEALFGYNIADAGRAALKAHSLGRDAAAVAAHTGEKALETPGLMAAFKGHLYDQRAAKQYANVTASANRLQAAGLATEPLLKPMQGPMRPDHMPTRSTSEGIQRIQTKANQKQVPEVGHQGINLEGYHPAALLGGAGAVGGIAASDNMEDAPTNIAAGAGLGLAGGIGLRHLKKASLNPSMNIGPIGMGVRPDTERLPGTYRSVPASVIQRVGEGMDRGMSPDEAVAYGAKAPEISATPAIGAALGAAAGHYIHGGPKGLLLGGGLGYAGGTVMKAQLQKDYTEDARTALHGLALERARMGIR